MTEGEHRLITIPFSHYCEKARWALDRSGVAFREEGHLPLFHYLANRRAGAGRTVPVLVYPGGLIGDSTEIIAFADAARPGALLPTDAAVRADAVGLEDDFDRHLGPATRRWAYFQMLARPDLDTYVARGVPGWQVRALRLSRPLAIAFLKRSLRIDAAGAARSKAKIDDTFEQVSELLRDGRRFLVGDRFSVADLTFAALSAPVLAPAGHPFALPPPSDLGPVAHDQIEAWRATRAGRFALRMYAEERRAVAGAPAGRVAR
ncbi:MAG: glutathione S-transferase [Deltaproteobacteria bacterium]|nr:glutathione S-transferase [Deltaproteobacteria bacterium]MCW5804759.1 glutathione S-transferase [Deltaproteobacteria bacterium]